jgi:tRNA A-37 threonylcarbamoyl transferase component Bud32
MVQTRLPSRYRVLAEVGQGGMAVVYRAEDETLKREVAIKVLHAHLMEEPESKERLQREAQAVAKLHHDNILQVFDYSGGDSPASYIVTEFIDGQTLKQFFTSRKTPPPEVAALIAIEVGAALSHAHEQGILHRDVKPENVMVRRDGMLKLMDFGVAQIVDLERMTVTGQLVGSPAYMAPEVFDGKPLDFRTDVFSVGIMLYQMATGALPFSGRNPHEVLKRIAEGRFADPRTLNRLIADRLSRVISRALERKPEDRYPSVAAMVSDLRAYVADAGLDDARVELHKFFTDPDGYETALPARVVTALVQSGKREQTAGKLARALECWNRALALEPRNADVLKALNRLEGRRRVFGSVVIVVGAAGLSVLIWGAFRLAREDVPSPIASVIGGPRAGAAARALARDAAGARSIPPATTAPARAEVAHKPGKIVAGRTNPAPPTPHHEADTPVRAMASARPEGGPVPVVGRAGAAATTRTKKTFVLAPTPMGVNVLLDGKKQFTFDVDRNTIDVPWDGRHVVEFQHERYEPYSFPLGPDLPRPIDDRLVGVLKPRIASLRVELAPRRPDAHILVVEVPERPGGVHTSLLPGEQLSVSFDAGDEPKKTLEVSVYLDGRAPVAKRVGIASGQKMTVQIPLD